MKKPTKFFYVYRCIRNKHPDWSPGKLRSCTIYAIKNRK